MNDISEIGIKANTHIYIPLRDLLANVAVVSIVVLSKSKFKNPVTRISTLDMTARHFH